MTHMSALIIDQASKSFGPAKVLDEISLAVAGGEFVTLLGPSGCGKSTLLRAIAGLGSLDSGAISIGGHDLTDVPVHRRQIGMVFQSHALFPHMTVAKNVAFGLKMQNVRAEARTAQVDAALELVRLTAFGQRYPHELSGGQQQRVAIARALVIKPRILLLDEPFAALDRKLREEMQIELRNLTRRVGITTVFVTHDQEEALTLSDRIAVMNAGRIEQIGAPDDVYSYPETPFVADFMGCRNLLAADLVAVDGEHVRLRWGAVDIAASAPSHYRLSREGMTTVAIRPEYIRASRVAPGRDEPNTAAGRVMSAVDQGAFISLCVEIDNASDRQLFVRRAKADQAGDRIGVGDPVSLVWRMADAVVLRAAPRSHTPVIDTDYKHQGADA
jgi:spermidine/putrescine ABC transporter ATP-binding subunit